MAKIFKFKKALGASVFVWALPLIAAAADVEGVLSRIKNILYAVIALLFVLVTLYFIWGIVQYISAGGDEEKMKQGKQHMIWGVIGMAVMAAAWGLVKVLIDTFGVGGSGIPSGPGTGF